MCGSKKGDLNSDCFSLILPEAFEKCMEYWFVSGKTDIGKGAFCLSLNDFSINLW